MDNVQTKVPSNRRGKFLVVGLLFVIFVMSFHLYREQNFKKELIRRKAFLIARLRDSKTAEVKMSIKVEGQRKELIKRQTQLQQVQNELTEAKSSYYKQMAALKDLEKSAIESKKNLAALQKQLSNASSTIKVMEDKLVNTVDSCEGIKDKNKELNKVIKEKENHLENCSQEKESLSKAKQDMENYYKRQMTLLQQTKVVGTGVKSANIIPPGVQNQQSTLTNPVNIAEIPNPVQSVPLSKIASTTYQNLNPNLGIVLTQMPQKVTQYNEIENEITKNPDLGKTTQPAGHVSTLESNQDGTRTDANVI